MILLYTHGILEREDASGNHYGERRLFDLARRPLGWSPQEAVTRILDDADEFAANTPMSDDSTVLFASIGDTAQSIPLNGSALAALSLVP